jgi:hypothetical protein
MVREALVAPLMLVPFFFHWKVGAGVPLAAAVKVAGAPTTMDWLSGCVVMAGAVALTATVSTAPELVAEPALLVATRV